MGLQHKVTKLLRGVEHITGCCTTCTQAAGAIEGRPRHARALRCDTSDYRPRDASTPHPTRQLRSLELCLCLIRVVSFALPPFLHPHNRCHQIGVFPQVDKYSLLVALPKPQVAQLVSRLPTTHPPALAAAPLRLARTVHSPLSVGLGTGTYRRVIL